MSAQHTITILCLVSKRFLPLARSHLYRRPFSASLPPDWSTASALLASLVKTRGHLGSHVKSLYGIISYTNRRYCTVGKERYVSGGYHDWYLAVVRACPNLIEIDLAADTEEELTQLMEALRKPCSELVTVNFVNFGGRSNPLATSDRLARKALQDPALRNVQEISLHRLKVDLDDSTPIITQRITSLSIDDNYRDHSRAQQLMPLDCSNLIHFELTTWIRYPHIVTYLALLPSTIRDVSLNIRDDRDVKVYFDYTSRPADDLRIPYDALSSFPDLLSFSLYQFPTLSRSLLDTLLDSSPLLVSIDFKRSVWVLEQPHDNQVPWVHHCEDVFPLSEIIVTLKRFKFLRRVRLGHVPSLEQVVIGLEEAKGKVDFLLEWETQPLGMETE